MLICFKEVKSVLQAYEAYYQGGRVIPRGNPSIPEGSELIITIIDAPKKSRGERQREAFKHFMAAMESTPPLPAEFDEIIAQRVNITREVEL
jgi:hypothetical protein